MSDMLTKMQQQLVPKEDINLTSVSATALILLEISYLPIDGTKTLLDTCLVLGATLKLFHGCKS